jgi:hypothetical protein
MWYIPCSRAPPVVVFLSWLTLNIDAISVGSLDFTATPRNVPVLYYVYPHDLLMLFCIYDTLPEGLAFVAANACFELRWSSPKTLWRSSLRPKASGTKPSSLCYVGLLR